MTEKDWGPIFYDDYRTWASWRDSGDKSRFHPFMLARSEDEIRELTRRVLHRQMTYRRTHMREDYINPIEIQVGEQLRPFGNYALEVVLDEFHRRAPMLKNDAALGNLKSWAEIILGAIDPVAGHRAAEAITEYEPAASNP